MTIRTNALFNIVDMTGHGGWRVWGYKTKESSDRIKADGYFNRARNRVDDGDEILVQVDNDNEWCRMRFVVRDVDRKNQVVKTVVIEEHHFDRTPKAALAEE